MRTLALRLLLAASATASSTAAAQACGGVERWAVKMAADPGASQIVATPQGRTLHQLVTITKPTIPSDDATRTAAERVVYVVDARLMRFKKETGKTGDSDYHLVISDETGLFSPGTVGSTASTHSFVAEIPEPTCVGGRDGQVTATSRFAAELQSTLTKFQQQFPSITSGWNDVGGIPVRLTGVAFFDRDHRQVGRAPNGLELHPLIDIEFNPTSPPPVPATPVTTVAVANAGFESGNQGWTATAGVITSAAGQPARTGQWKAWLGGYGEARSERAYQSVTLPATGSITLSFYLHVDTEETSPQQYDTFRVRVRDTSGSIGQILATLKTYSNLDAATGFRTQALDLSQFRGRTVRLSFEAVEDGSLQTSFVVDDVRIVVEP